MRYWIVNVLLFLVCSQLDAQVFSTRVFSEDKGLEQKFIFSIDQDTNGVLILGTESGVISYNGDFFSKAAPVKSLAEQQVSEVCSGTNGTVWVGHFQSGITSINRNVASIVDSTTQVRGRINSFTEDAYGNVWGVSEGNGLFRVDPFTHKVNMVSGGDILRGTVVSFNDHLVVGSESGVRIYEVLADLSVHLLYVLPETQNRNITSVCLGKMFQQDVLFVAVENDGVYYYTAGQESFELRGKLGAPQIRADVSVSAIEFNNDNTVWIGTMGHGLYKLDFTPAFLPRTFEVFNETSGLIDNNIQSLFVDTENNLWIGTFGSGLVEIPYSVFRFYTTQNGLLRPEVNCVLKDDLGDMWIGTDSGVSRISASDSKQFDASNGFVNEVVSCLSIDTSGRLWIGTEGKGVYVYSRLTDRFENISQKYHLNSRVITGIVNAANGEVYVGTSDGLYIFADISTPPQYYTTLNGLAHNNIRQLNADASGNVWFASQGSPPYMMQHGEVKVVNDIVNLQSYVINSVCDDASGQHWVTTDGDGVFSFTLSPSGGSQVNEMYSMQNGLRSDHCIAASTDEAGILWIIHRSGISMKFPGDSFFYSFTGTDNKLFDKLNPCVFHDVSGSVYLCSENGLIEVMPDSKEYLRQDPRISLASLFIDGSERVPSRSINLEPGSYNLTFEFNRILFSANTLGPFYYRIMGADTVWRSATGRSIVIPQLSAGNYELQVLPSRNAMLTGATPYSIRITIDFPFWQKTWFTVMLILVVPMLVYSIIRIRTVSLVNMNERLQVLVKEKTFLLETEKESVARINVELEQKSKDITDSIRYAKRIQLAILTDMEIFQRNFPDSFVFYQPRDIVSGDFYWFAERDNLFFIAIADCTGHGVPGAFMSMISSTLINKVVFDQGHSNPAVILESLNKEIKTSLHQQASSDSSHDGLDVALCVVDKATNILRFAGAGRPLLHVRGGEVTVYKTHKGGLGGVYTRATPVFDEITLELHRGDCFYMYSDGFTDQFGGARQSKFSSPNLRGLLKMIASLPMEEQGNTIRDAFNTWKGTEEQCDDVLIAGFKV